MDGIAPLTARRDTDGMSRRRFLTGREAPRLPGPLQNEACRVDACRDWPVVIEFWFELVDKAISLAPSPGRLEPRARTSGHGAEHVVGDETLPAVPRSLTDVEVDQIRVGGKPGVARPELTAVSARQLVEEALVGGSRFARQLI
ncbi:MAG: hypothetical protein AB7I38_12320 [Dehalococcoidia bacterium]